MTTEEENRILQLIFDIRAYIAEGFIDFKPVEATPFQLVEVSQLHIYQQAEWGRLIGEMDAIQGLYWERIKKPTRANCLKKIQEANKQA